MFQGILSISKNLLRGWDPGRPPSLLLGQNPNFDRLFFLMASLMTYETDALPAALQKLYIVLILTQVLIQNLERK